jgi:hypothetical protein
MDGISCGGPQLKKLRPKLPNDGSSAAADNDITGKYFKSEF